MSINEMGEILKWLGTTDITELDIEEQCTIQLAQVEMCENIKPIYIRHKVDSCEPFIMRL